MEKLHSPKDSEGENKKPIHPNRQLVLQDLMDLEKRIPSKTDLSTAEKNLSKLIKQARFDWTVGPVTTKVLLEKKTMVIKLTNEQQVSVTLNPRTDAGRTAKLDGVPAWTVVSGESTVTPSTDGLSALIVSSDNLGDTQILVKADADLGEGVEEISEILEVQVAGASAKNLGIVVGTPEVKPEPAP